MHYNCPVCGFPDLEFPPQDHTICPSCGTQFGYDDVGHSHIDLRKLWIWEGAPWFLENPPPHWDPWMQLIRAGFGADIPFRADVEHTRAVWQILSPQSGWFAYT